MLANCQNKVFVNSLFKFLEVTSCKTQDYAPLVLNSFVLIALTFGQG